MLFLLSSTNIVFLLFHYRFLLSTFSVIHLSSASVPSLFLFVLPAVPVVLSISSFILQSSRSFSVNLDSFNLYLRYFSSSAFFAVSLLFPSFLFDSLFLTSSTTPYFSCFDFFSFFVFDLCVKNCLGGNVGDCKFDSLHNTDYYIFVPEIFYCRSGNGTSPGQEKKCQKINLRIKVKCEMIFFCHVFLHLIRSLDLAFETQDIRA